MKIGRLKEIIKDLDDSIEIKAHEYDVDNGWPVYGLGADGTVQIQYLYMARQYDDMPKEYSIERKHPNNREYNSKGEYIHELG